MPLIWFIPSVVFDHVYTSLHIVAAETAIQKSSISHFLTHLPS